jgi:hypothetical protein
MADNPEDPARYGFKLVTEGNLLEPDPLMGSFATREGDVIRPMVPADLLRVILPITLENPVPFEVRKAFMFARDAMCYAFWYYPLITLGAQQILRVADYATDVAGRLNGIASHKTFGPRIDQLRAAGVLDGARISAWNLLCEMRNRVTHPEWQQTWMPSDGITIVRMVADEIQALRWPATVKDEATT